MMCDVMPTISEDGSSQGDRDSQASGEGTNVEDMLLSMLDERDRLMENLRETQEQLMLIQNRLEDVEKERDALNKQILDTLPQDVALLAKEVHQLREHLVEREEEVSDLKAERNNTRLLLEHLECLVSRHERSLRMTVVKRQASSPAGVSSEVEVLKALKSLFEHHKALDEKVRERLRVALERCAHLEDELKSSNKDRAGMREQLAAAGLLSPDKMQGNSPKHAAAVSGARPQPEGGKNGCDNLNNHVTARDKMKRQLRSGGGLVNGALDDDEEDNISQDDLDDDLDEEREEERRRRSAEVVAQQLKVAELISRIQELEEGQMAAERDSVRSQEEVERILSDLRESEAQRDDQEERIVTLEQRYLSAQREVSSVHDQLDKMQTQLVVKETELTQTLDKLQQVQERLESVETKVQLGTVTPVTGGENAPEPSPTGGTTSTGMGAVTPTVEERLKEMATQFDETQAELQRAKQRERLNEEHNSRLSSTVDRLLLESNERLQTHLREKMSALEEKNGLNSELDRIRKLLDESRADRDRLMAEGERHKRQTAELKQQLTGLQQQKDSLSSVVRRSQRGRDGVDPNRVNTLGEGDWEKIQQVQVLTSVQQAFDMGSTSVSGATTGGPAGPVTSIAESGSGAGGLGHISLSPGGTTDPQTLALMIQDQLDAINNEIRLIQEEKENAEHLAEQLESRVGSSGQLPRHEMVPTGFGVSGEMMGQLPGGVTSTLGLGPTGWSPPPSPLSGRSTPMGIGMGMMASSNAGMGGGLVGLMAARGGGSRTPHQLTTNVDQSYDLQQHQQIRCESSPPLLPHGTIPGSNYLQPQGQAPYQPLQQQALQQHSPQPGSAQMFLNTNTGGGYATMGHRSRPGSATGGSLNSSGPGYLQPESGGGPAGVDSPYSSDSQESLQRATGPGPHPHSLLPAGPTLPYTRTLPPPTAPSPVPSACSTTSSSKKKGLVGTLGRIFKRGGSGGSMKMIAPPTNLMPAASPYPEHRQTGVQYHHHHQQMGSYTLPHPMHMSGASSHPSMPVQEHNAYPTQGGGCDGDIPGQQQMLSNYGEGGGSNLVPTLGLPTQPEERRRRKKEELLAEAMQLQTPFGLWHGPTIVAWLELWVGMPAWYVAACRANVKSGAIMAALSDQEIQREIGISNPLHRLKLRLAIQEMVALTAPTPGPRPITARLAFGDMNHEWVGNYWLPSLGLPQYRPAFMECLVDARMLDHLTKRDLRTHLKMVDNFHRTSLLYGIVGLKRIGYDREELERRRLEAASKDNVDLLVWPCDRVISWLEGIGLREYAGHLSESGVHGTVLAMDPALDHTTLALLLQIPSQAGTTRDLLQTELASLRQRARVAAGSAGSVPVPPLSNDGQQQEHSASEQAEEKNSAGVSNDANSTALNRGPSWRRLPQQQQQQGEGQPPQTEGSTT